MFFKHTLERMGKLFLQYMWIYGSCYRQLRLEAW